MHKHMVIASGLVALGLASAPCGAQTMKAGLWEIQNQMQMQGNPEMSSAMEKMQKEIEPKAREIGWNSEEDIFREVS